MNRPPPDDDATIRLSPRQVAAAYGRPKRRGLLFGLLGGAVGLAALGAGAAFLWLDAAPGPQRLGRRRLLPPLLRARFGEADLVFALARRSEQDEGDPPGAPAPRERLELLAFEGADLRPRFVTWMLSVPAGEMPESALIAEQAGTVWLWVGGLGAVSAMDGMVLADQDGIAELNPDAPRGLFGSRRLWQVRDALTLDRGGLGAALRIDPRNFRMAEADSTPLRPLPAIHGAAPLGPGGPTAFRVNEARLEGTWFGLPAQTQRLVAPMSAPATTGRYLSAAELPPGTAQALWRGTLRMASGAPPGWPAGLPDRWRPAERLFDLQPVEAAAGLHLAGFLTAGTPAPIVLADPPGLLLVQGAAGKQAELMRIGAEGRIAWRAPLPMGALRSVLPGPGYVVLLDGQGGPDLAEPVLVAVALADGRVTERPLNA